jgi:transposase-like protein
VSKEVFRYSEAFKGQVVSELERGRFGSAFEAAQAYGIRGHETVSTWVKQYGKSNLLRKVVRVESPDEPGELRRLRERVRDLESALADAHIDGLLTKSYFEILCERTGTDPVEFKKKHGGKRFTGRGKRKQTEEGPR